MKEITVTANTLDGLRKAIERIAAKISAQSNLLPSSPPADVAMPDHPEKGKVMSRFTGNTGETAFFLVAQKHSLFTLQPSPFCPVSF
jgi:hypothetical protein